MSGPVPGAFASFALFATLVISGACIAAPANTANADDCLAAPNSAGSTGQRWYYRLDRATQRKCWYLRAPGQPAKKADSAAKKGAANTLHSAPATSGPPPAPKATLPPSADATPPSAAKAAPAPVNSAEINPLPPQIETMSAMKPPAPVTSASPKDTAPSKPAAPATPARTSRVPSESAQSVAPISSTTTQDTAPSSISDAPEAPQSTMSGWGAQRNAPVLSDPPPTGATIDKSVEQSAHDEIAPAASGPPASTPSATGDQAGARAAVTSAPLVKVPDPTAVPADAPALTSDDGKRAAGEPTNSSGMLIMCALILGIALLRAMWRATRKYAAAHRNQIFTDDSWHNPYEDPEFCRRLRQGLTPENPSVPTTGLSSVLIAHPRAFDPLRGLTRQLSNSRLKPE